MLIGPIIIHTPTFPAGRKTARRHRASIPSPNPTIVVADTPTWRLRWPKTARQNPATYGERLNQELGTTLIMVTHDGPTAAGPPPARQFSSCGLDSRGLTFFFLD